MKILEYWKQILQVCTFLAVASLGYMQVQLDRRYDDRYAPREVVEEVKSVISEGILTNREQITQAIDLHASKYQHLTASEALDFYVTRREYEARLERYESEINRRFDEVLQAIVRLDTKISESKK